MFNPAVKHLLQIVVVFLGPVLMARTKSGSVPCSTAISAQHYLALEALRFVCEGVKAALLSLFTVCLITGLCFANWLILSAQVKKKYL